MRVCKRLGVKADKHTLKELANFYRGACWKLYPDVKKALSKAKGGEA